MNTPPIQLLVKIEVTNYYLNRRYNISTFLSKIPVTIFLLIKGIVKMATPKTLHYYQVF